ncbi:MAG: hypothetical protein J6P29_06660, partial [Acetobacter sp.]|nr:hypothetical protein [Acetobacter sp.]
MTVRRLLVLDGSLAGDAAYGLAACVTREEQKKADLFSVDLFSVQAVCQQSGRQAAEGIGLLLAQALEESGWGT